MGNGVEIDLIYKDEVYSIIGAAMEVHRHQGSGLLGAVYQEAMEMELSARGIENQSQVELVICYKGVPLKKKYVADLVCFGKIIVELKVMDRLTSKEESQLLNYLNTTRMRVGLLINYGATGPLDWKRFVL